MSASALIRAAHADLVGRFAEDAETVPEGAYTSKVIRGRRYWYIQTPTAEGRRQKYVGPETPDLVERIERHRRLRDDERERRVLVSLLVRTFHVPRPPAESGQVVAALAAANVFRDGAVLLGALAGEASATLLGTPLPGPTPAATDPIEIASRNPPSLLAALQGVSKAFRVMSRTDGGVRVTSYVAADGLRVDVLTPKPGDILDYLLDKPERAVVLHESGVPVAIPAPARYALARLLAPAPTDTDVRFAQAIADAVLQSRPEAFTEAWQDAERRGWRPRLIEILPLLPLQTATSPR